MAAEIIPLNSKQPSADRGRRVLQAIQDCREIAERSRALGVSLAAFSVPDVELLLEALTGGGRPVA